MVGVCCHHCLPVDGLLKVLELMSAEFFGSRAAFAVHIFSPNVPSLWPHSFLFKRMEKKRQINVIKM